MANCLEGSQTSAARRSAVRKPTILACMYHTYLDEADLNLHAYWEFTKLSWKFMLGKSFRATCLRGCSNRNVILEDCVLWEKRAKDREQMAVNLLLLDRDLGYQTGGQPTRWSRISSPAAAFILTSSAQMDSNQLTVPCKVPSSGLKYEAFGGRERQSRERKICSF